jgi:uncharacterized membrane protein
MILAASETRWLFYPEGLTTVGGAVALAGGVIAVILFLHWLIRRLLHGPAEPILPWWQILIGAILSMGVALMASAAVSVPLAAPRDTLHVLQTLMYALLMAAVVVCCGTWVLFFYLRLFTYMGRLPLAVMLALRVLAILLLVLLIFKPTLSYPSENQQERTDLYVLIDASRSMSVSDYPDSPNRLATATRQIDQYLGRLQDAFNVKLFWFDTRAHEAKPGEWPEPQGDATNIVRPLKDILGATRPKDTKAVILLSDGLHNSGGNVIDEITALGLPPIDSVGIGTDLSAASGYQDISIAGVRSPEEATVNNTTRLSVDVSAVGLPDRMVQVQLLEGKTVLATEPLRLASQPGAQSVTFGLVPTVVGRHTYTARVPPDPAERRAENNERAVHLLVTDPKVRVLYIEGTLRPEYKPLRTTLESDPNVELLALVQERRGVFSQSGNMAGVTLSGLPQTADDLRKFDVFIIGDVDRTFFSAAQMESFKTVVSEGRGLVMLGGTHSLGAGGYEGTPIEDVLPVAVGPRSIGQEMAPFNLKLTADGANHPIFTGIRDFFAYQTVTPKEKLPPLSGCNVMGRPKPGASVLAIDPERKVDGGPLPVLVVQPYGKGRSAAFAADTTNQWYLPYRALGRESPYTRFWGQLVRWLASKEIVPQAAVPGVNLVLLKQFYNPGEKITVRARVRAEEGRATNLATASGVLVGPKGERTEFLMPLKPGSTGEYEAVLGPPDPGKYRLSVEARKDKTRLGVDETDLEVGRENQEFDRLGIDRTLLRNISQATGGQYYEPSNFGDLVDSLHRSTVKEVVHREVGIQTVPGLFGILFGVFLAMVTAEWLLRKYYQLT